MRKEDEHLMDDLPESALPSTNTVLPNVTEEVVEAAVNDESNESIHIANILFDTLHWTPSRYREEILKLEKALGWSFRGGKNKDELEGEYA